MRRKGLAHYTVGILIEPHACDPHSSTTVSNAIAELLFDKFPTFTIVERQHLKKASDELEFQQLDLFNPSTTLDFGNFKETDSVIYGHVSRWEFSKSEHTQSFPFYTHHFSIEDFDVAFNLKLFEASTGRLLAAINAEGDDHDGFGEACEEALEDAMPKLERQLIRHQPKRLTQAIR